MGHPHWVGWQVLFNCVKSKPSRRTRVEQLADSDTIHSANAYLASQWPSATVFAHAMSELRSP